MSVRNAGTRRGWLENRARARRAFASTRHRPVGANLLHHLGVVVRGARGACARGEERRESTGGERFFESTATNVREYRPRPRVHADNPTKKCDAALSAARRAIRNDIVASERRRRQRRRAFCAERSSNALARESVGEVVQRGRSPLDHRA